MNENLIAVLREREAVLGVPSILGEAADALEQAQADAKMWRDRWRDLMRDYEAVVQERDELGVVGDNAL